MGAPGQNLLSEQGVAVTTDSVITPDQTYALSGVVSVSLLAEVPSRAVPIVLIALGMTFGVVALVGAVEAQAPGPGGILCCGVTPASVGAIWLGQLTDRFTVVLHHADGQTGAVVSRDGAFIQRVVDAVTAALAARS